MLLQAKLYISVQPLPAFTVNSLLQNLMIACGGKITEAYFKLLDTEISDCLYHLYLFIDLKEKQAPPEKKLEQWDMQGVEFLDAE
ncbi:hypothetical protein H6G04_27130 [Calothrix membranacea FACHB-236]|nr:hypothetical protein [Calothrix membranacea FACHB-236]